MLAACGGASAPTRTRSQAAAIVGRCTKSAGATGVVRWGYVMSGKTVVSVYATLSSTARPGTRQKLDACLEPYGWTIG